MYIYIYNHYRIVYKSWDLPVARVIVLKSSAFLRLLPTENPVRPIVQRAQRASRCQESPFYILLMGWSIINHYEPSILDGHPPKKFQILRSTCGANPGAWGFPTHITLDRLRQLRPQSGSSPLFFGETAAGRGEDLVSYCLSSSWSVVLSLSKSLSK